MISQCTRCKKKFHKKPKEVSYIETEPYCNECYGIELYLRKLKRNAEKEARKNSK